MGTKSPRIGEEFNKIISFFAAFSYLTPDPHALRASFSFGRICDKTFGPLQRIGKGFMHNVSMKHRGGFKNRRVWVPGWSLSPGEQGQEGPVHVELDLHRDLIRTTRCIHYRSIKKIHAIRIVPIDP